MTSNIKKNETNMGTITDNFSYMEFEHSRIAESQRINNAITDSDVLDNIKSLVETVLQPLRNEWPDTMPVNSGFRCSELNKAVGGVPTSQHTKGEAADIGSDDPLGLAQKAKDLNLPYDQMIIYPSFVHFSHKRKGPQRKQILYNRRWKGDKLK